jgi:hypothetical protein
MTNEKVIASKLDSGLMARRTVSYASVGDKVVSGKTILARKNAEA